MRIIVTTSQKTNVLCLSFLNTAAKSNTFRIIFKDNNRVFDKVMARKK